MSFAVLFICSCSKDGDSLFGGTATLTGGTWDTTSLIITSCSDDNHTVNVEEEECIIDSYDRLICYQEVTYSFHEDGILALKVRGTLNSYPIDNTYTLEYEVNGNSITICDDNNDCSSGGFNISGKTLSLSYTDEFKLLTYNGCDLNIEAVK